MNFFKDILNIIFPQLCVICEQALAKNEELLCFKCRSELPRIKVSDICKNEITEKFDGKLAIEFAVAYYYFLKSGKTQKLLHQLKYKNHPEIGYAIGFWLGSSIAPFNSVQRVDCIIPVPLHSKKEYMRGYNQSKKFADGLSDVLDISIDTLSLQRKTYTISQTKKTKEQRWQNVKEAFEIKRTDLIKDKHILLVDDVITTGATLESCGIKLKEAGAKHISIASIALAQ